jgi:LysR family transcriptional regulator, transcription activator of glutamate synthase operon
VPFESTNLGRLRDLVARGLGVALLARSVAETPGPPVTVHSVRPEPVWRPVGLLHHRERPLGAAARACRAVLLERAAAGPGVDPVSGTRRGPASPASPRPRPG